MSLDHGFLGERGFEEKVTLVLVFCEQRLKMTWAMLVPRWQRSSSTSLGTTESRSGATTSRRLRHCREIAQARQEGSWIVMERSPVGESQSSGIIERAVGLVAGQARTPKAARRIGTRIPDARILDEQV